MNSYLVRKGRSHNFLFADLEVYPINNPELLQNKLLLSLIENINIKVYCENFDEDLDEDIYWNMLNTIKNLPQRFHERKNISMSLEDSLPPTNFFKKMNETLPNMILQSVFMRNKRGAASRVFFFEDANYLLNKV